MKTCLNCKQIKDESLFRWKNKSKGWKKANCIECDKVYDRKYHQNRPLEKKKNKLILSKKRIDDITEKICLLLLNKKCIDCGQSDIRALDFDHQENKTNNIGNLTSIKWSWERVQEEIEKCVVRCANCHRIKTHKERKTRKYLFGLKYNLWE